jgi:nucleotide-binding universal stress UspA family protein
MMKILIPVDGSDSSTRATESLIRSLAWYKETPQIDLLAVHLPVPNVPRMGLVISPEVVERYYAEECEAMLGPSKKLLEAAQVEYCLHTAVGPIAETIVDRATRLDSSMICMGTRGMSAISNLVLGSTATKVLHLAQIPVVLNR